MAQLELNPALAKFCRKPGDPPLNPSGKTASPEKLMKQKQIKQALLAELDEACTIEGFRHLTWLEAGLQTLLTYFVLGEPWAVRETLNRAYGKVPVAFEAAITVGSPLEQLTTDGLIRRAEQIAANARTLQPSIGAADDDFCILPEPEDGEKADSVG